MTDKTFESLEELAADVAVAVRAAAFDTAFPPSGEGLSSQLRLIACVAGLLGAVGNILDSLKDEDLIGEDAWHELSPLADSLCVGVQLAVQLHASEDDEDIIPLSKAVH